jgi:soluble lytic murein transglycosylase-like protein
MSAAIAQQIKDAANHYGVDPGLALQVATVESGLNQAAVSPKGARGVFQLMPATAASLGVNPNDAAQNIDGGGRYLAQLLSKHAGDSSKALFWVTLRFHPPRNGSVDR